MGSYSQSTFVVEREISTSGASAKMDDETRKTKGIE